MGVTDGYVVVRFFFILFFESRGRLFSVDSCFS